MLYTTEEAAVICGFLNAHLAQASVEVSVRKRNAAFQRGVIMGTLQPDDYRWAENVLCFLKPCWWQLHEDHIEALTEPTFRITKAADHAVIQNAVEIAFLRQMIDRGRSGDFLVCHVTQPPRSSRGAGSPAPPCRCAPCFFGVFVLWGVSLPSGGRARSQLSPRGVFRWAETAFSHAFLLASFCASLAIRGDTILIHDFGMT